jgi:hypothetical protein
MHHFVSLTCSDVLGTLVNAYYNGELDFTLNNATAHQMTVCYMENGVRIATARGQLFPLAGAWSRLE